MLPNSTYMCVVCISVYAMANISNAFNRGWKVLDIYASLLYIWQWEYISDLQKHKFIRLIHGCECEANWTLYIFFWILILSLFKDTFFFVHDWREKNLVIQIFSFCCCEYSRFIADAATQLRKGIKRYLLRVCILVWRGFFVVVYNDWQAGSKQMVTERV